MVTPAVKPDRTLIAILAIIAGIVVISIVVLLTRGTASDADPTSPEGAVQSYSRAIVAGDYSTAREHLATAVRENCESAQPSFSSGLRMTVSSTTVSGTNATVRVAMQYGDGLFGGAGYEYDAVFTLILENQQWKVTSAPWEFALCYGQGMSN